MGRNSVCPFVRSGLADRTSSLAGWLVVRLGWLALRPGRMAGPQACRMAGPQAWQDGWPSGLAGWLVLRPGWMLLNIQTYMYTAN